MILNSLRWKFTSRDHYGLNQLNIFSVLYQGDATEENLLKNSWGLKLETKVKSLENQSMQNAVVELFENLFMTVASRIVESDEGKKMQLKASGNSGKVPALTKMKSVVNT